MKSLLILLSFSFLFAVSTGANSQTVNDAIPRKIGEYGQWTAYVMTENNKKVCYMASQPTESKGNYTKRGPVYAVVTHRPVDKKYSVINFQAGYQFAPGSEIQVTVGEKKFTLFTEGEGAWARDDQDQILVKEMAKAGKLTVNGTSCRGTKTEDTYSLSGSSRALTAINQACNIK